MVFYYYNTAFYAYISVAISKQAFMISHVEETVRVYIILE